MTVSLNHETTTPVPNIALWEEAQLEALQMHNQEALWAIISNDTDEKLNKIPQLTFHAPFTVFWEVVIDSYLSIYARPSQIRNRACVLGLQRHGTYDIVLAEKLYWSTALGSVILNGNLGHMKQVISQTV